MAILVVVVAGGTMLGAQNSASLNPSIPDSSSILEPYSIPESSAPQLMARALPGAYSIPPSCSVPILPSILTEEEIKLRQFQADFAKYIEGQAELDQAAALTTLQDVMAIKKFQLDCEIKVLRAKEILRIGRPQPTPDELAVTDQEIELRKRQLAIAKQLDDDEIVAHEAGLVTLNRVWTARRNRIDAEILLLQATVKQKNQSEQQGPE